MAETYAFLKGPADMLQLYETKYKQERKERLDYYLVSAKFNEREFTFKSNTLPGSTVKVTVTPEQ